MLTSLTIGWVIVYLVNRCPPKKEWLIALIVAVILDLTILSVL
jgi:hypothetical protein